MLNISEKAIVVQCVYRITEYIRMSVMVERNWGKRFLEKIYYKSELSKTSMCFNIPYFFS